MGTVYVCVQWVGEMKERASIFWIRTALCISLLFRHAVFAQDGDLKFWIWVPALSFFSCVDLSKLQLPILEKSGWCLLQFLWGTSREYGLPWWFSGKVSACQCWRLGKWQPTVIFLPGKSHGQGSLAGCNPWGRKRVRRDFVTEQQQSGEYKYILFIYLFLAALGLRCCMLVFFSCKSVTTVDHALCFKFKYSKIYKKVKVHCGLEEFRVVYQK